MEIENYNTEKKVFICSVSLINNNNIKKLVYKNTVEKNPPKIKWGIKQIYKTLKFGGTGYTFKGEVSCWRGKGDAGGGGKGVWRVGGSVGSRGLGEVLSSHLGRVVGGVHLLFSLPRTVAPMKDPRKLSLAHPLS